ncbi:hypothetical protein ACQJBY_042741 [Aegilops geniculata]
MGDGDYQSPALGLMVTMCAGRAAGTRDAATTAPPPILFPEQVPARGARSPPTRGFLCDTPPPPPPAIRHHVVAASPPPAPSTRTASASSIPLPSRPPCQARPCCSPALHGRRGRPAGSDGSSICGLPPPHIWILQWHGGRPQVARGWE